MRSRVIMVLAIVTIVLGGVLLVPTAYARLSGDSGDTGGGGGGSAALITPPPPTLAAAPVSVPGFKGSFFSWALLDRKSGKISGAKNITATNSTESMIKVWIVSDYLRRLGDKKPSPARLTQATNAILHSDNDAAQSLYVAGGKLPVLQRMIETCKLTDTSPRNGARWAYTQMSAEDAVRLGECVKGGDAAGQNWTEWLLDKMSKVEGSVDDQRTNVEGGRWGIIDGLPEEITSTTRVSIKNGWTYLYADSLWHVNCLAVTDDWVLAVLMRYPNSNNGIPTYGASVCASVASQLVTPQPGAALKVPRPLAKR
jgi:hypothetical protein